MANPSQQSFKIEMHEFSTARGDSLVAIACRRRFLYTYALPGAGMYLKLAFATKKLGSRLAVISGTLILLLVVGSTLYFDVRPTRIFHQQVCVSFIDSIY